MAGSYVANSLSLQDQTLTTKLDIKLQDVISSHSLINAPYALDIKSSASVLVEGSSGLQLQVDATGVGVEIRNGAVGKLYALPSTAPANAQMVVADNFGNLIFQNQPTIPVPPSGGSFVFTPMQQALNANNYGVSNIASLQLVNPSPMFSSENASVVVADAGGKANVNFTNSSTSAGQYNFDAQVSATNFSNGSTDFNSLVQTVAHLKTIIFNLTGIQV